jgi:hypothetical protein
LRDCLGNAGELEDSDIKQQSLNHHRRGDVSRRNFARFGI